MANLYAVLGVNRTATTSDIKSAYRRLARQYHPDVNSDPSAGARFSQISQAYQTLIDPERRKIALVATAHYLLRAMLSMLRDEGFTQFYVSRTGWTPGPPTSSIIGFDVC